MQSIQDFLAQYDVAGGTGNLMTGGNNALYQTIANDLAGLVGFSGPSTVARDYTTELANEGGTYQATMPGFVPNPDLLNALKGYQAQMTDYGSQIGSLYGPSGATVGGFKAGDPTTNLDTFMTTAIPAVLAAGWGSAIGGALGGLGGEAGAALSGEASSLAPSFFEPGATFLGESVGAAAPWSTGLGGAAGSLAPMTLNASLLGPTFLGLPTAPALTMGGAPSSSFFDAGSKFLGEQVPGAPPMGQNPLNPGLEPATPLDASFGTPSIPGAAGGAPSAPSTGLLGQLGEKVGDVSAWMKANPMLGKLLMAGGTSLLASSGGGGGGSSAQQPIGPAKQWSSPLQQGLLGNVQQTMPVAQQRPAGLLAQGNANTGAWRFLGGK